MAMPWVRRVFGAADEVAAIALMLASNGYITGQTINVNGGWYMS
jgi:3-oxoacyl-[acyl-carrier protein] reductase